MSRLPSPDEVLDLWRRGASYQEIASKYGVSRSQVRRVCDRARGNGTNTANKDRTFTHVGSAPVKHRTTSGTGGNQLRSKFLTIDDCDDLLREWGVR